jgi:hypothetical protein
MSELLADWVRRHVELLREQGDAISLDAVGEVVGAQPVSVQHIEALLDALEADGLVVRETFEANLGGLLERVLLAARTLRSEGRSIAPAEVATRSGLSVREVRVALLYAHVLER